MLMHIQDFTGMIDSILLVRCIFSDCVCVYLDFHMIFPEPSEKFGLIFTRSREAIQY